MTKGNVASGGCTIYSYFNGHWVPSLLPSQTHYWSTHFCLTATSSPFTDLLTIEFPGLSTFCSLTACTGKVHVSHVHTTDITADIIFELLWAHSTCSIRCFSHTHADVIQQEATHSKLLLALLQTTAIWTGQKQVPPVHWQSGRQISYKSSIYVYTALFTAPHPYQMKQVFVQDVYCIALLN